MSWAMKAQSLDPKLAQFGLNSADRVIAREEKSRSAKEAQAALFKQQTELQAAKAVDALQKQREHDQKMAEIRASLGGKGANPFFQFLPTTNGIAVGDARTGTLKMGDINGQPVVRPQDSPGLQGNIAEEKKLGADMGEQRALIKGKEDALQSVKDALNKLDAGIYTGGYAQLKLGGSKLIPGVSTEKAAKTEEFISHIGNVVIPRLKEFGGNDSNEEMRFLQKVSAGDITMEESALRAIVQDIERKMTSTIGQLKARGGTTSKAEAGLPPVDKLKEGQITTFGNGQSWTLRNGKPVQVK
jgi:hypothetical protein